MEGAVTVRAASHKLGPDRVPPAARLGCKARTIPHPTPGRFDFADMPIENISDTARWVAVYRAMESARRDAIFNDPFAARLAGEQGTRIVSELKRGKSLAWPMIVRTAVFDDMIMDRVANHGVDTVVNLAA